MGASAAALSGIEAASAVRAAELRVNSNVAGAVVGQTAVPLSKPVPATALTEISPKSDVGDCQGNACGDVSVDWTGHGYHISNHGVRRVLVRIRFTFGLQCLDWSDIHLGPGQSQDYGNGAFCNPYTANYE